MEMTPFELTPEQKGLLHSLSQETGKPISALIAEALKGLERQVRPDSIKGEHGRDVDEDAAPSTHPERHIWDIADALLAHVPDEELNRLPPDGATQVDH